MDDSAPFVISGMTTTVSIKHLREAPLSQIFSLGLGGAPHAVNAQGSIKLHSSVEAGPQISHQPGIPRTSSLCPSPNLYPGCTEVYLGGSFWGSRSWGRGRYAWRGLPERKQLKFTSQKEWGFFYSKLQNVVWLIRAIINGNIIIQASISTRSHLNEYIFCLGAVAASELLKRNERKKKKKPGEAAGAKPWRMGPKELSAVDWEPRRPLLSLRSDPSSRRDLEQDHFSHLCCQNRWPCISEPPGLWHCGSEFHSLF